VPFQTRWADDAQQLRSDHRYVCRTAPAAPAAPTRRACGARPPAPTATAPLTPHRRLVLGDARRRWPVLLPHAHRHGGPGGIPLALGLFEPALRCLPPRLRHHQPAQPRRPRVLYRDDRHGRGEQDRPGQSAASEACCGQQVRPVVRPGHQGRRGARMGAEAALWLHGDERQMVNIEETFARKCCRIRQSLETDRPVLVRRVVEARRLAASGGVDATHSDGTAALPRVNEKDGSPLSLTAGNEPKRSFWSRLRCW
jgi:hypothetical protein